MVERFNVAEAALPRKFFLVSGRGSPVLGFNVAEAALPRKSVDVYVTNNLGTTLQCSRGSVASEIRPPARPVRGRPDASM